MTLPAGFRIPVLLLAAVFLAGASGSSLPSQEPSGEQATSGPGATSTPAQLRMALAADGQPCLAASLELGRRGAGALTMLTPLAAAARTGCGVGGAEPRTALVLVASAAAAGASSLSREELTAVLAAFTEAEAALGGPLPTEVEGSLASMRSTLRGRNLGWLSALLTALGAMVREGVSALGAVGGLLVALLVVAAVLLGLRNARRLLPTRASWPRPASRGGEDAEVELWLERRRHGSGPAGSDSPADAPPGEDDPVGGRVDVILGSLRSRYVPGPEAPPREAVERVIQAVAWETLRGGSYTGWVPLDQLEGLGPPEAVEPLLAYAGAPMGALTLDTRRRRVRATTPPRVTTRLGSLHLLRETRGSSTEILAQVGTLHASLPGGKGNPEAGAFLSTVAAALLEAAEGDGTPGGDLGVAEEALRELAQPGPAATTNAASRDVSAGATRPSDTVAPGDEVRVRRLLARLRAENHPVVREKLVAAIGQMGPAALPALPALRGVMEGDTAGVALSAVEAVGRMGPGAGEMAPLLMGYLEGGHHGLRVAATRALGRLGQAGTPAAPLLMEWVSRGGVPHELRARAAEALGTMPGDAATVIPPLAELLRSPVAVEVRAAAALALARLDTGRPDVSEALARAQASPDPALRGMVGIALLVRERRLAERRRAKAPTGPSRWALPLTACAGSLAVVEGAAVTLTQLATPGALLPALLVTPALAFPAGVAYGVATRSLREHPALGGGAAGWAGASIGLLSALLLTSTLSPSTLAIAGGLALGSGAAGGTLVRTALKIG